MDFSIKSVDVINLFIEDVVGTKAFYQDVLGLQAAFEDEKNAVFKLANIMIHLLDVSDAPDMIAPAMVARPEAGSRFVIAAFVDDVDEVCAELARRGVELRLVFDGRTGTLGSTFLGATGSGGIAVAAG